MNLRTLESKILAQRKYGNDPEALSKFIESTKNQEFDSIQSSSSEITSFKTYTYDKGSTTRAFSKINDDFYSMESINFDKGNNIEGFTKYIIYNNNGKIYYSPSLRLDIGGKCPHDVNTINNKYFTKSEGYPHIHFMTLDKKSNKMVENAISLSHLKTYFQDLAGIKTDIPPEKDILENSYGMPYLDMKKNPKKYGIKNFDAKIKEMINSLDVAIELVGELRKLRSENKNLSNEHINEKIYELKLQLLSNIADITLQPNIKNYCNEQLLAKKSQRGE